MISRHLTAAFSAQDIIDEARTWIGTPYQHQASCRGVGTDCLGLVRGVYLALYGTPSEAPPAYAPFAKPGDDEILWHAATRHLHAVPPPALPGQILMFRMHRNLPARHLAIMSFQQNIIHALSGAHVCEVDFGPWWRRHCVAAFAFPLQADLKGGDERS